VASKHASAVKAHRQSLKRREHNRQFRSQLRGALKTIRSVVDEKGAKDAAGVKKALSATVSFIDKMAAKGIIHRNAAARYKSRIAARLGKKTASA
jgi:small subunit ribosomal protein S20